MKKIITTFIATLFLTANFANAKYAPLALHDLVGASDLIVIGSISQLNSKSFILEVSQVIAGDYDKGQIKVEKFKDWTCAARWCKYDKGQNVMLFLEKPDKNNSSFSIRSGGGEGEMPVVDEFVYYRGRSIDDIPQEIYKVFGESLYGQKISLEEFINSIQQYRKCFQVETDKSSGFSIKSIQQLCSPTEIESYRKSSKLSAHLVKSTLTDDKMVKSDS